MPDGPRTGSNPAGSAEKAATSVPPRFGSAAIALWARSSGTPPTPSPTPSAEPVPSSLRLVMRPFIATSLSASRSHRQVLVHGLARLELLAAALGDDRPFLQDDAVPGHAEDHRHVLLDDHDLHALGPIDRDERLRDLRHQRGHDAVRGLVQ